MAFKGCIVNPRSFCYCLVSGLITIVYIVASRPVPAHELNISSPSRYRGYQYMKPNATIATRTIVETPFARAQMHTVRLEDGKVVDDWLWFDEGDAINCLARTKAEPGNPEKYVVFEQSKYGFEGVSLAPIGGYIESGESALFAAKRELLEETGLTSDHWVELGAYRVAANRGAGVIHTFLAVDAVPHKTAGKLMHADLEAQKAVLLSEQELLEAVLANKFKEVKWTANVALALLASKN
mmetsp:Transcript_15506/g.31862  ORF Transcript_15506/g.31862 Transcript_15506/m.31862 type:complete len:239 (-) Transcript_15506:7-723(-)